MADCTERPRDCPTAPSPDRIKRPRSSPDQDKASLKKPSPAPRPTAPCPPRYKRLHCAHFPREILALEHVMYHIDAILMSPSEAAERAATTGQDKWLLRLLHEYQCNVPLQALVAAAANGHLASVVVLVSKLFIKERIERTYCTSESWRNLLQAVVAAGSNGHIHVVRYLLPEVKYSGVGTRKWEACSDLLEMFKAAAKKGHLDVVKCALQHARQNGLMQRFTAGVGGELLARVITGRKNEVLEHLLALDGFQWDLEKAFVAALEVEKEPLAEVLLGMYRQVEDERKLFIAVAQGGHLSAVRHLYSYGRVDADLVDETFVKGAELNRADVVAFLYDTGKVSPEAFDEALLAAVTSKGRTDKTVEYLCAQGCASAVTISQAFKIASSISTIAILYRKADISDVTIISAFKTAAGCGIEFFAGSSDEDVKIVQLLHADECIPVDVIAEAFFIAVKTGQTQLVELFRNDARVSPDTMDEAFVKAATREDCSMMKLLYDEKRISPDALVAAFKRAAAKQLLGPVKEIVRWLSVESHVPREVKYTAFLTAATFVQVDALRILCQSQSRGWPLVILEGALNIADNDRVKAFIREVICNQLFDSNAPGRFDAVSVISSSSSQVEAIRTLLVRGAALNKHGVGSAALATAAQRGHEEVIKLLLDNDVDVNAQDGDGDSALHETVYSGSADCARALILSDLRAPINLDVQNKSGWTPLAAAAQRDLVEIAQLLLQKKAVVKLKAKDGHTALHVAAEEGRVDVIRLLLEYGAKIDAVTKAKWTPLMLAANRGHRETVKFLVKSGANVTWKNSGHCEVE